MRQKRLVSHAPPNEHPMSHTFLHDLLTDKGHHLILLKEDMDYGEHVYATSTLVKLARSYASSLQGSGLVPGMKVALVHANMFHSMLFFWAAVFAGAIPVICPVETLDLQALFQNFEPDAILMDQTMEQSFSHLFSSIPLLVNTDTLSPLTYSVNTIYIPENNQDIACGMVHYDLSPPYAPHVRFYSHRELLSTLHHHHIELHTNSDDIFLCWQPLYSPTALTATHLSALYVRANQIFLLPTTFPDQPFLWCETVHQHRVTRANLTPTMAALMVQHLDETASNRLDLSSLRTLLLQSGDGAPHIYAEHLARLLGRAYLKESVLTYCFNYDNGLIASASLGKDLSVRTRFDREALAQGEVKPSHSKSSSVALPLSAVDAADRVSVSPWGVRTLGHITLYGDGATGSQTPFSAVACDLAVYDLGAQARRFSMGFHTIYALDLEQCVHDIIPVTRAHALVMPGTDNTVGLHIFLSPHFKGDRQELINDIHTHLLNIFEYAPVLQDKLRVYAYDMSTYLLRADHYAWRFSVHACVQQHAPVTTPVTQIQGGVVDVQMTLEQLEAMIDALNDARQHTHTHVQMRLDVHPDSQTLTTFTITPDYVLPESPDVEPPKPEMETSLHEVTQQIWPSVNDAVRTTSVKPRGENSFFEPVPHEPTLKLDTQLFKPRRELALTPMQRFYLHEQNVSSDRGWVHCSTHLEHLDLDHHEIHRALDYLLAKQPALRVRFGPVAQGLHYILDQGNHVLYKRFEPDDKIDILHQYAMDRFLGYTHKPLHHGPLVHWLAFSYPDHTFELHQLSHLSALDAVGAHEVLDEFVFLLNEIQYASEDDDTHTPLMFVEDVDALMDRQDELYQESVQRELVRAEDLNAAEFWSTLFNTPYRHISLRDARYEQPHREVSIRLLAADRPECDDLHGHLVVSYTRCIEQLHGESLQSLVIGMTHHVSCHELSMQSTYVLPVRVNLERDDFKHKDENYGMILNKSVQKQMHQSTSYALSPDAIARHGRVSPLVAQGIRFAMRYEPYSDDESMTCEIKTHGHSVAVEYPHHDLNELFLQCREQDDGSILFTLHIADDVQLGMTPIQVMDALIAWVREV